MVDTIAKDYWSNYFGDYGKLWVKDVPRKVASALTERKLVTAAAAPTPAAQVAPLGFSRTDTHLTLEGVYKSAAATLLFSASFNAETGDLTDIQTRKV